MDPRHPPRPRPQPWGNCGRTWSACALGATFRPPDSLGRGASIGVHHHRDRRRRLPDIRRRPGVDACAVVHTVWTVLWTAARMQEDGLT